jgi:signal transduction histidine kinase
MQRNFLLSITHELKSPLASIRLILDTFRRRPNLQPEQVTKLTQSAIIETERLQELVENLLLASRLEASYQPQPEDIRIDDMVRDIFEKIKIKYPKATFTLKSPEAVYLHADAAGIESVLSNLIENAAKYSGSDKPVTVSLIEKAKNLVIEVADEGIGISDDDKALVFRRFYRAGNEDTRTTKGTGLGLYIVQEITQRHGGHVLVRDNQPRGTVFEVQFPMSA